jgi:SAM-dependent methyltransferase
MNKTPLTTYKILSSLGVRKKASDQMTPWGLALKIVDEIPERLFNSRVLIPGSGFGTFALALVYRGWNPAMITSVELDSYYVLISQAALKNLGLDVVHSDFLTWNSGMKFDVIIGNPPYQRPKHAEGNKDNRPLWIDFLARAGELLSDGGWCSLLVPGQVAKSTRWDEAGKGFKALQWGNILSVKTGVESWFNVGSFISQVTVTTGEQGLVNVNGHSVDIAERPWLPTICAPEAFSILDKISSQTNRFSFKLGLANDPLTSEWSIGFWRLNQNFGFTPQWSSERDTTKKMMWISCDPSSKQEAEQLTVLLHSRLFTAFRRLTFYEPNYAHLLLSRLSYPDIIPTTDEEVYEAYGITEKEVQFIESICQ